MSKVAAIILLIILAVFLIFFLKALIPVFSKAINQMPKGIFILVFILTVAIMIYLICFLLKDARGGNPGIDGASNEEILAEINNENHDNVNDSIGENCVLLQHESIWIDGEEVDIQSLEKYIDEHVENNIEITIIDDYSTSVLHHQITDLCDTKGVKYKTEDETWIE